MEVDSFRYLSSLIKRYYQLSQVKREIPIPFAPVRKPLRQCRFALVTSGGLYHRGHDEPFDQERERREPSWGDPPSHPALQGACRRGARRWSGRTGLFLHGLPGFPLGPERLERNPRPSGARCPEQVDCVLLTTA